MPDFKKLIKSFFYAFRGLMAVNSQQNMRIHLAAAVVVVVAGIYFRISIVEWCLITLAIGMVISAEIFNTAIETMIDLIHPEQHPVIGKVKDMAAGAVLVTALSALVAGILIFGKYIF